MAAILVEFRHPDAGLCILKPDGKPACNVQIPAATPRTRLVSMKVLHSVRLPHGLVARRRDALRPNAPCPLV
jgi:hypothetical protein